MSAPLNSHDYRRRARRILPRGLFEYIDRGTEDETALARLRASLDRITLAPSVLAGHSKRDLTASILGVPAAAPLVVAPTAMAGLVAHDGEVKLARAAAAVGLPFCVSTQSITSIEAIRQGAPEARLWFQLYVWRDRGLTDALIEQVKGCDVLVVTADTAVSPNREYNRRNGFGVPIVPGLRNAVDVALHPRWLFGVLARYLREGGLPNFAHYPPQFRSAITRPSVAEAVQLEHALSWDDLARIRERWPNKLVVKGVLTVAEAERAAKLGADAIVVSAHGGRNLDCLPAPADVLPAIAGALAGRLAVFADSGVRRGTDVLKYLALGAEAVLVGRLPLWGLAAGGEAGAEAALRMLTAEMDTAMALLGAGRIADLEGRAGRARQ